MVNFIIVYIILVMLIMWNIILSVMLRNKKVVDKSKDKTDRKLVLGLNHVVSYGDGITHNYTYKAGVVSQFIISKCDTYGISITESNLVGSELSISLVCTETEFNLLLLELLEEFRELNIVKSK